MAWRIPIVDLAAEYLEVGAAVEAAVLRVLRSQQFILGPETAAFESELAARIGVEFAVGVSSGTEALALALRAVGVGPGDEVVTSAFTYFASVEAILLAGARPVFADIEANGFGVDPARVEAALGPRTRAILPIHLFGRCADLPRLQALADARGIALVEDAAQAIGASPGRPARGRLGPRRLLQLLPLEEPRRRRGRRLRHDRRPGGRRTRPALPQPRQLARWHARSARHDGPTRCAAGRRVAREASVPGWLDAIARPQRADLLRGPRRLRGDRDPRLPSRTRLPVWNQYTIRCRDAGSVRAALEAEGIEWRHYYPMPAASQPALGAARCAPGSFPEAERACAEVISIPVRPSCSPATIEQIADVIRAPKGGPTR